jgi:nucleoside-diphosphate-sugar epimerase
MIIGNGLLANAFSPRYGADPNIIIFASGVSNSLEMETSSFDREQTLLNSLLKKPASRIVYFGSCSSLPSQNATPYLRHKYALEKLVATAPHGLVLRLPQVVGRTTNPNTLTNFIYNNIISDTAFTLWENSERNLVDVFDVARIGSRLIDEANGIDRIHTIASRVSLRMPAIVAIFEDIIGRKARYTALPLGGPLRIDASAAWAIADEMGIDMGNEYTKFIIRKYYASLT